jgi:hypothetical protein
VAKETVGDGLAESDDRLIRDSLDLRGHDLRLELKDVLGARFEGSLPGPASRVLESVGGSISLLPPHATG